MVSVEWILGVERKVRDVVRLALYSEEDAVLATGNNVGRAIDDVDVAEALRMMACH